jgi:hypothetical protein
MARTKVELTLQYVASGGSITLLQYAFRISKNMKVGMKVMPSVFLYVVPDRFHVLHTEQLQC